MEQNENKNINKHGMDTTCTYQAYKLWCTKNNNPYEGINR